MNAADTKPTVNEESLDSKISTSMLEWSGHVAWSPARAGSIETAAKRNKSDEALAPTC
jgi:hypothetical protein